MLVGRELALDRLEGNDRQPEQLGLLEMALVDRERHHLVLAVVGEVEVHALCEGAGAEDDDAASYDRASAFASAEKGTTKKLG